MRAVVFDHHGGPEVLSFRDVPDPEPGHGEVRVKVAGCAVNHLDLWVRDGIPGVGPFPHILGSEVSGTIDLLGPGVQGLSVGEKVLLSPGHGCGHCEWCVRGEEQICPRFQVLGNQRQGGYAEYVVVKSTDCLAVNERLTLAEWAAVPLVFQTAWHMLVTIGKLRPGQTVLIESAGSGVGTAAIQIARLIGARVIATAATESKRLRLQNELGADVAIDYREEDIRKRVKEVTKGRGVDIAFAHVGGPTFGHAMATLARGGLLVTCGASAGPIVEVDLRFLFSRELRIAGAYLGTRADLFEVVALVAAGKLKPVIDSILPLTDVQHAHERVERREVMGKIVLVNQ